MPDGPALPRHKVTVIERSCLACGEAERDVDGRQVRWPAHAVPTAGTCARCGARMVLPYETIDVYVAAVTESAIWDPLRPRIGRRPRWLRAQLALEGFD